VYNTIGVTQHIAGVSSIAEPFAVSCEHCKPPVFHYDKYSSSPVAINYRFLLNRFWLSANSGLIWAPYIACSATRFYPEDHFELFRANVHHSGRVRWWFGGVMETSCHLDGTLFPFDSQSCSIVVQSWAYSEAFVDLQNGSNFVHLEKFNDDGNVRIEFR